MRILPMRAMMPERAKPMIAVFLVLTVTSWLKKWMSSLPFIVVYLFSGLIICIKSKFHNMLPTPNATTSTAVILFFASGNWVHMQFRMGIELIANIVPGIIIENTTNVKILNVKMFINGQIMKIAAQTRSTN